MTAYIIVRAVVAQEDRTSPLFHFNHLFLLYFIE